jgi:antitoxin MazE
MTATVQKWGNSLALRIPSALAKDVHLFRGSVVDVSIEAGRMVVRPKRKQRKYSLALLVKGINRSNRHGEEDWGGPVGREVW